MWSALKNGIPPIVAIRTRTYYQLCQSGQLRVIEKLTGFEVLGSKMPMELAPDLSAVDGFQPLRHQHFRVSWRERLKHEIPFYLTTFLLIKLITAAFGIIKGSQF